MVDVLDVDRALLDTRAAGRARPQGVFVDDRQLRARGAVSVEGVAVLACVLTALTRPDEWTLDLLAHLGANARQGFLVQLAQSGVLALCRHQVWGLGEHRVAKVHDHQLRAQRLVGVPRGALVLAAAALGAGHEVDVALPGELRDVSLAELRVVGRVFEVDRLAVVVDGQQWTQSVRSAGRVDVDRGRADVQVLGVEHDHQEPEHHDDLTPDANGLQPQVGRLAQRGEQGADPLGGERATVGEGERPRVDLRPAIQEQGRDDQEDHEKDHPGAPGVRAEEPGLPAVLRRVVREPDDREDPDPDQHEHREQVLSEAHHRPGADDRDVEVSDEERPVGLQDRQHQDQEAPEREHVRHAGHRPLQQLALAQHLERLGLHPLGHVQKPPHSGFAGTSQLEEERQALAREGHDEKGRRDADQEAQQHVRGHAPECTEERPVRPVLG